MSPAVLRQHWHSPSLKFATSFSSQWGLSSLSGPQCCVLTTEVAVFHCQLSWSLGMNTPFSFSKKKGLKPLEAGCGRALSFLRVPQLSSLCKRPFNQAPARCLELQERRIYLLWHYPLFAMAIGAQFPKMLQLHVFLCKDRAVLKTELLMEKHKRASCAGNRRHMWLSHHFIHVRGLHGWEMEKETDVPLSPQPWVLAERWRKEIYKAIKW